MKLVVNTMEEGKGKSAKIEWMQELLPDGGADIGMWQQSQRPSADRPNTYQLSLDSNNYTYPHNLSQNQLVQTSSLGRNLTTSHMVKKQQESFNVVQRSGQTTLQKILGTQSSIVADRMHPRLQTPTFHQSQNLTLADQLKPGNQMQNLLLGHLQASSESTPQVELTNAFDWVNQAHNKIQQMKEMYLSELLTLCSRAQEIRRGGTNVEAMNRYEKTRTFIEKILRFLNSSKSDLLQWRKEKLYQTINDVMKYLNRLRAGNSLHMRQTQQVEAENFLQSASSHQSLRQGVALSLPQSSLNSFKVGSSAVNKVDASSIVNPSYNPMRSTQQWAQQGSVVSSPQKTVFDQQALRMMLLPSSGVSQQNNLCSSQPSSRNIFNSLDFSVSSISQTPVLTSPPQINQQDPAMKRQQMKQPVQQLMSEKNKQQMMQKRGEDTNLRRFVGFNQRCSPALPPSSSPYITVSPQNSQQSSSQLGLKDLSSKLSKSATPSLSASPSAIPSPLTPLTPSSMPADSVKSPLFEESSKIAKTSAALVQLPLQDKNQNQVAADTQRLTKSCLHRESTSSGEKQSSHDKGDPLKRLVEVVKSISSGAFNAALRDIDAVTNLTDRIAGHFLHGTTKVIFQDLADDVSNCDNGESSLEDRTGMKSRMKRKLDTVALKDTETEFCGSDQIKRLKKENNNLVLQEIKEINRKLIEVVVDVMPVEDVAGTGSDEGILIRCSYIPVGVSRNIKTPNTSKLVFPNLLLDLIVSDDYPNSSPTVLETIPSGFSDAEEGKYLWMKAKANFSLSLRKFSQPISVKEMAEAWGVCAREVFHEFAKQMGGGNFSSTYGNWENCAVAG